MTALAADAAADRDDWTALHDRVSNVLTAVDRAPQPHVEVLWACTHPGCRSDGTSDGIGGALRDSVAHDRTAHRPTDDMGVPEWLR